MRVPLAVLAPVLPRCPVNSAFEVAPCAQQVSAVNEGCVLRPQHSLITQPLGCSVEWEGRTCTVGHICAEHSGALRSEA